MDNSGSSFWFRETADRGIGAFIVAIAVVDWYSLWHHHTHTHIHTYQRGNPWKAVRRERHTGSGSSQTEDQAYIITRP